MKLTVPATPRICSVTQAAAPLTTPSIAVWRLAAVCVATASAMPRTGSWSWPMRLCRLSRPALTLSALGSRATTLTSPRRSGGTTTTTTPARTASASSSANSAASARGMNRSSRLAIGSTA